ncbi:hypothetical protein N7474_004559 [Penicillium riverlandense]|uniref:uncharacterized protein n=1 Tax=Penicillium riverlandense TaxID=1903569 RepID=UPI002548F8DB|nr:uncharacterized protein N7474_004559 [Penicillium riverlandense]KAJ5818968.1 hypothetical protein N7474_004559 [Penicillium riverlandense]
MGREAQELNRPAKRRKIAIACDDCRTRKVRCDGVQPVCGPCAKRTGREVQCVYTGEQEKKRAVQTYIASLENRLKVLESPRSSKTGETASHSPERGLTSGNTPRSSLPYDPVSPHLAVHTPSLPTPVDRHPAIGTVQPSPPTGSIYSDNIGGEHGQGIRICAPLSSHGDIPSSSARGNGVNAMMGAVEEERAFHGFFGSSSAAGFMRQIKTAVDKRIASPQQRTPAQDIALPADLMSARSEKRPPRVPDYVLPPRKTADSLMEVYWNNVFPLYPFVDSAQMKGEYAKIWTGDSLGYDENMLMCTFNVIFALASQLADFIRPEDREVSADSFFSRAKDLFQFNLWNTGSAGLIQCLLLMAQYLQSTDSAHQCWIVTGLAIRNAQSLGLHLPQTIACLQGFQEQQLARKIWHGCVLMDRVISMTFGRPAMISKASSEAVPLPAAVDEEYILASDDAESAQPADRPSMMAFYAKSLELYEIMNDVLLSLYKPSPDEGAEGIHDFFFNHATHEGERTIFDLDRSLTRWTLSLPPHLKGASALVTRNPIFCRQSIVLRARFLHVRMLLFRPTLSKYCAVRDNATTDPLISVNDLLPQRVALQCSIICVKVAQESIELIYSNVPADGTGGPLPAWWYNILYVYTAATVLIAGRLCPAILEEVTEATVTRSWNCALEILRKYQSYSTSARRCVAALEILYERVASEGSSADSIARGEPINNVPGGFNEISFGEGMNAAILENFEFPDFQDMSWLNSVPSNLF